MLRCAREALVLGLTCLSVSTLSSCESNTLEAPVRANGAPAYPRSSATDAPTAIVVEGTGDAGIDVPAVQAAVDRGGEVILRGHFSFDAPATKAVAAQLSSGGIQPPFAEVLVARDVSISGGREEDGAMATIDGGTIPFYVDAPGQPVAIRGLRFVEPTADAILVYAVQGLEVADSRIEGAAPFRGGSQGIAVLNAGGVPSPTHTGHPENVSGTLRIIGNDIDMAGGVSSFDNTLGITVFSVGVPGAAVDAQVIGNRISNVTEPAINFRRVVGRVDIEHNDIETGTAFGNAGRNAAIRVANTGSYRIAHNAITCDWAISDAEGIAAFSQFDVWPLRHATVEYNDIRMRAPEGTAFTGFSAGLGVYGYADSNMVRHNTIRGAALAALSIPSVFPQPPQAAADPQGNAFIRNRFVEFTPTDSDILVGTHARDSRIVGRGSLDDQGSGTVVVRTGTGMTDAEHSRSP